MTCYRHMVSVYRPNELWVTAENTRQDKALAAKIFGACDGLSECGVAYDACCLPFLLLTVIADLVGYRLNFWHVWIEGDQP